MLPLPLPQPLRWLPRRQAFRAAAASGARGVSSNTPAIVQQKLQLLEKLSTLDRGALASSIDRYEVESLVRPLEQARGMLPFQGEPVAALDGKWQLVYSSVEAFRSSPFFWAFPSLVGGDRQLAAQIFAFTDSIPGADVGPAYQTISVASGQLVSEVELRVWPGVSGYVVTSSRLAAAGESDLEVRLTWLSPAPGCQAACTTAAGAPGAAASSAERRLASACLRQPRAISPLPPLLAADGGEHQGGQQQRAAATV